MKAATVWSVELPYDRVGVLEQTLTRELQGVAVIGREVRFTAAALERLRTLPMNGVVYVCLTEPDGSEHLWVGDEFYLLTRHDSGEQTG